MSTQKTRERVQGFFPLLADSEIDALLRNQDFMDSFSQATGSRIAGEADPITGDEASLEIALVLLDGSERVYKIR